jgi:hypothetical protein
MGCQYNQVAAARLGGLDNSFRWKSIFHMDRNARDVSLFGSVINSREGSLMRQPRLTFRSRLRRKLWLLHHKG